jgi:hypothetical protein
LLEKRVDDELRIATWEWLRILARTKKKLKIMIIEDDYDLESMFKGLLDDENITIQQLGMAIICNFSIDFPGMILTFKDFMPKVKEFLLQKDFSELKFISIKILKNLLYAGHTLDICQSAEKAVFDWIEIKEIYKWLDDPDRRVVEQAEIIFKNLHHISKRQAEEDKKPKSILESIEDETMKARIEEFKR